MSDEQLDDVFTALADRTRRRIIDLLRAEDEQSLFQICTHLTIAAEAEGSRGISRQAVSQHLDLLERAQLVSVSWLGRTKLHSLDPRPLKRASQGWIDKRIKKGTDR